MSNYSISGYYIWILYLDTLVALVISLFVLHILVIDSHRVLIFLGLLGLHLFSGALLGPPFVQDDLVHLLSHVLLGEVHTGPSCWQQHCLLKKVNQA